METIPAGQRGQIALKIVMGCKEGIDCVLVLLLKDWGRTVQETRLRQSRATMTNAKVICLLYLVDLAHTFCILTVLVQCVNCGF